VQVFWQTKDQGIVVNGDVTVTVLEIVGDEALLAIDAPPWVEVALREECEDWTPRPVPRR
jgi:sRNA-binding carbon storage regulator CsrA